MLINTGVEYFSVSHIGIYNRYILHLLQKYKS